MLIKLPHGYESFLCSPLSQYLLKCLLSYHMDTNHISGFEHGKDGFEEGSGVGYGVPVNLFQVDCRRHTRTWEGMIHKALEHAVSAGKRGAKTSRRESLDPKITLSVDRADNVQLNRTFTAENVARMIINRGRSGTESLRKGDLLPPKIKVFRLPGARQHVVRFGWREASITYLPVRYRRVEKFGSSACVY